MCKRYTGNLLFHIACEVANKRRGHLNAGYKNFCRRYKHSFESMHLLNFVLDNFNYRIYKMAFQILFEKDEF